MTDVVLPHTFVRYKTYNICATCGYGLEYVLHSAVLITAFAKAQVSPIAKTKTTLTPVAPVIKNPEIFLPRGTRYWEDKGDLIKFLIELPPDVVTMTYKNDNEDADRRGTFSGKVAVPWTYLWITVSKKGSDYYGTGPNIYSARAFWARERISSLTDKAYIAQMPNVEEGRGDICLGSTHPKKENNVVDVVETFVAGFYESKFNPHYGGGFPYGGDAYRGGDDITTANFQKWKEETKKNPYIWMDWEFIPNLEQSLSYLITQ